MSKKISKSEIGFIGVIILFFVFMGSMVCYGKQYTEREYSLYEMNDGVYAIYYTVHSEVPAQNYEVVTVCSDGNILTFSGNVYISFTDSKSCVRVKDYNIVNADDIYIYVPQGTVRYQGGIAIGD